MKHILLVLFLITILSCQKDDKLALNRNSPYYWRHIIQAHKGDQLVDLWLINPLPFSDFVQPVAAPDYVEIYYGTDSSALKFFKKVEIDVDKIAFTKLVNNTVYYFAVKSYGGEKLISSDTVRTIPCSPVELSEITTIEPELYSPRFVYDSKFISWAHLSNNLIYASTIMVSDIPYFNKLKFYDADKSTDDVIADIDYAAYNLGGITLSNDDKALYINSSEGRTDKQFMDIWMLKLDTKIKTKVSNFASSRFHPSGRLMTGVEGKSILLEGGYDLAPLWSKPKSIYRYNLDTKQIQLVVKSIGYDVSSFAESPDGKLIAFVSNWTGTTNLWVLNTANQSLKLLTSVPFTFGTFNTGFKWIDNTSISINLYESNVFKSFKIKI